MSLAVDSFSVHIANAKPKLEPYTGKKDAMLAISKHGVLNDDKIG